MLERPIVGLVAATFIAVLGCSKPQARTPASGGDTTGVFKIGVMTGTASQCEEDFRGGEDIEHNYPGRVRHITYPDNFPSEVETVVAQLAGLAADPEIKIIMVGQAIPGSVTAARRIRATRPDILIGLVSSHEDPDTVDQVCDLAILPDQVARGSGIVASAQTMGAKNVVHYSFPRHMSQRLLAQRRDIMRAECRKRGMDFLAVTAPDPIDGGGLQAAQRFILEDVPRRLRGLGPATAFYATDDGMQEPLIKAILLAKAGYFVEQDAPTPTAGYPAALGLKLSREMAADVDSVHAENKRLIAGHGMSGHFGTWAAPVGPLAERAMANLLVDAVDRKADPRDSSTVLRYLEAEAGCPVHIRRYGPGGNQWLITLDHVTY
jgi:hypothetical protein